MSNTENTQNDLNQLLESAESSLNKIKDQQEREAQFAAEANPRFEKNLNAFKRYYPDVAQMIESFQPRDDFCLHVTQSGHANFYPIGKDVPLYGDDPLQQAIEQVERYTEKANFGRTNYMGSSEWKSNDSRIHMQYMQRFSKLLSEIQASKYKRIESLPESYPTAMIFGIGLGYHIPVLLERHKFDYIFICEPDLELFFASLFCIDWEDIIQRIDENGGCLFLHLGISYENFFDEVYRIANEIGAFSAISSFCYQHYPSADINKLIKNFFDNYYQLQQGYGFYNDAITGLAHAIHNVEQGAHFLFAKHKESRARLKNIPAFVIGNGPSLDQAIELIKKYQGEAVIFAAGTAFQSLKKVGINPDFHVLVERPKSIYDIVKEISPEGGYGDTNLLSVDVLYPDTMAMYKWAGLGLKGPEAASVFLSTLSREKYGELITELPASGPFVSNTAFSFAISLGFTSIYLLGVDNGYSLEGKTHSALSIYNDKSLKADYQPLKGANIRFKGNLKNDVMATPLMAMSKNSFDRLIEKIQSFVSTYNVGEGAELRGAIPLTEEQVLLEKQGIDKPALIEELKQTQFHTVEFDDIESALDFDEYESVCDYLLEIGQRGFNSREEAHELLKAQQRLVFAYQKSKHPHIFQLIKGTLLYFHCPLVTLLYFFEDEKETLKQFRKGFELWLEFVEEVKGDFRENWKAKCTMS